MNNYYNPYQQDVRQQDKLISDIEKAINGEYSAIECYGKLAKLATTQLERDRINEIRKDEIKHYQQFAQIYFSLTGRQPQPKISEQCAVVYKEGLEASLQDEQKTADFYQEIADDTTNQYIRDTFRRAASDEQNHAVWFLYFLVKNKR